MISRDLFVMILFKLIAEVSFFAQFHLAVLREGNQV